MILSDTAILDAMLRGEIVIDPFDRAQLGGNSYDVRLSPLLLVYAPAERWFGPGGAHPLLDVKKDNPISEVRIEDSGLVLEPGVLYLGATVEYTETHVHVPYLDGKSSIGRLGINIHATAGRGDVGFCNHWTMEITVVHPVRVYPHMKIGQLTYHAVDGQVERVYSRKSDAKYSTRDPRPQPSRMWRNYLENKS